MSWGSFLLGAWVGGCVGTMVMGVLCAASRADESRDPPRWIGSADHPPDDDMIRFG